MAYEHKHPKLKKVIDNIENVIIGKRNIVELSLVAMLADGHVLLEDVPGVGKTMMVRSLAKSINASFKRIQFTPDLLPSDVTGVSIYNPQLQEFIFRPGPIMGNIILADEINRTSPKTQAALLEGMEEASVTVDGVTRQLEKPFFVMATQNPIEYEGTYPLPEAQLDRFLLKMKIGYPTMQEEMEVLNLARKAKPIEELEPVISMEEIRALQEEVLEIHVEDTIKRYLVDLSGRTRIHPNVNLGVSPRGTISLMKAAQAYALLNGRDYVLPDDVQYLAPAVLSHRIILKSEAKYGGIDAESIIQDIVRKIPVPVKRQVN
ncbi:MoxR family ATPase [Peribacillus psychrosaccharolyticus]|uniref:MoxR family ATPase n=1 Tax=Peribacillus psychrosaccharolyticus TaxID=1407 RepID=A0A974RZT2_PERPY|nr:MoxR family ATPase [Peribacillus psychrosaccharolyticus]MEC2057609.1 MoxR family ATPase [Peribacillus psychrosaccharolyticus]MED3744754.1 MoxR family ATPase [Peribacillus psychrosaccharolyticus]QQS98554.1 MoxR family ATPase [Peribacillus psychrosaccharolyticus]